MKSKVIFLVASVFFFSVASADEIYLKDNTVIKGKILRVSEKNIEYDPEGDKPFDVVPREKAKKIVYEGGQTVVFDETVQAAVSEKVEEIPPIRQKGGYLDSFIYLGVFGGFAEPHGGLRHRENRTLHSESARYTAGINRFDQALYYKDQLGAELHLMLPAMKRLQNRGFELTGIKIGAKGRYADTHYTQMVKQHSIFGSAGYRDGLLLHYQYWAAGPVLSLVFSPRSNALNLVLEAFAVGGTITKGNLNAAPALRDAGAYWIDKHANSSRVGGYSITAGFGPRLALNKKVPITFGLSLTYTYTQLRLHRAIPVYNDNDRRTSIEDVGLEFSFGTHL